MTSQATQAPTGRPLIGAKTLAAALGLPEPTPEQVAVIEAPVEPMLVVAGAGAGKTETMASRVVWLVANQIVAPDEILGLTFTRKAASELGARIRRRLSMLSGSAALRNWDPDGSLAARLRGADPEVSTYHAYAGRLIADYGLLLPVEPSSTLLTETELWQLAFGLVSSWPEDLDTDKVPASVTEAVLKLYGEMSEHLVDIDDLEKAGSRLYELIDTLPKGPRQRDKPSQALLKIKEVIDERRALLPLVRALADTMRAQSALDFGSQMSLAARLVVGNPEVVESERAAFRAVLLDEYQDTGHSQRILLSTLFGGHGPSREPVAVTAVGDPIQSIYGWRGASAANLPRFARDFPRPDGSPAHRRELLTSWRNAAQALRLANQVSEELRRRGIPVSVLRQRPDAPHGTATIALTETVIDERSWIADSIEERWKAAEAAGEAPPTTAILVRRNEDSAPLAAELESRGIPAEVVGIGGLLHVPEIEDIIATLRVMADPMAGTAVMRLLTGARWRLGAKDLAALWRRATTLAAESYAESVGVVTSREQLDAALDSVLPTEIVDRAGLADAVVDPGDPGDYSPEGYARIRAFGAQLESLRRRIGQPLPELVADVEHTVGVGVEAQIRARRMRGAITGREHLDAFADYVSHYADRPGANLPGLLAFLDAAETIEKGLEPGKIEVADQRVQILTVHAAKGLEWDVVAIPHLAKGIFPSAKADTTWLGSARELPAELRGDLATPSESADGAAEGFPVLKLDALADRKQLEEAIADHKAAISQRRLEEDRRLLYVALTRARHDLLISAHHWSETGDKPRGGSEFFDELMTAIDEAITDPSVDSTGMSIAVRTPPPADDATNPLAERVVAESWPRDPLAGRRDAVPAADLVLEAIAKREAPALFDAPSDAAGQAELAAADPDDEIAAWEAEVSALLDEHHQANRRSSRSTLPTHLSVSQLVELDADEAEFARRLRRPMPFRPNPMARRGTAFHAWVERWFGATRLLDVDELPGAADATAAPTPISMPCARLFSPRRGPTGAPPRWRSRSRRSSAASWCAGASTRSSQRRTGRGRCSMEDRRGSRTGETGVAVHPAGRLPHRVGPAGRRSVEKVRAAFHYVRDGHTLMADDLPDEATLAAKLAK